MFITIKTTGNLISAIVDKAELIKRLEETQKKTELELGELTTVALNYPELMKAAKDTGILCGNYVVAHTVDLGFSVSRPMPYTASMSEELTSADQTKLNEGV